MFSDRPKRVTIADVAEAAGVSRTTVSHALNDIGQVDPRTRARVKEIAADLNYRPNVRAQRLRSGKSHALALLSSMSPAVSAGPAQLGFFTELAMGCARTALLRGYFLVLAPPLDGKNPVARLDIDGAILLEPLPGDPIARELGERGIPFVVIDDDAGTNAPGRVAAVSLHHRATADLLLGHLRERGAEQVGLIIGASGRASQVAFAQAYRQDARGRGAEPIVVEAQEEAGEQGGYEAAAELLAEHPDLDALCIPIDAFAVGAARAAADAGRTVGEDLLIATRYNGLRAQTANPPLTSVDLHLAEISSRAVDLLLDSLQASPLEGAGVAEEPAPPSLVVRASTAGRRAQIR